MHIHIPDGVLPVWLWLLGLVITFLFLTIAVIKVRGDLKKMTLAGMLTALVVLLMSIPLGIPAHINMIVFVGIIMGAYWSLIISFVANFILASFAHGGLSIIGLNTLILWFQALVGILIFGLMGRYLIKSKALNGGIAVFLSISLSFFLLFGVVFAANLDVEKFFIDDHDHYHEEYHDENDHHDEDDHHEEFSLVIFLGLTLPFILLGATIESIITFLGIKHIDRARPDLIK